MSFDLIDAIGCLAAMVSTISFMPQAIKIIRTRDTKSISFGMYSLTVIGFVLWTFYGVLQQSVPLIASNSICLIFSGFILAMKTLPSPTKSKVADAVAGIIGQDKSPEMMQASDA